MDKKKTCAEVFSRIDELASEYTGFLADICRIESPTDNKECVDAVGKYIMKKAEARGWNIEIQHQNVSGDCICITMNPDAPGVPMCYSGHMDTVHPVGLFGDDPVKIENGRMYGPGVIDCKGGLTVAFLAMAALEDCGYNARPIKLILQSDEENSSRFSNKTTVEYMCEKAKGCAAVLNMEGTIKRDDVCITRKGISRNILTVTGKAAHSSKCYDGSSAICEAAHKIIELEKYKSKEGITINCGLIEGGTAENTVPAKCTFTVDMRYPNNEAMKEAHAFLREVAEKSFIEGTTCEIKQASSRCPMEYTEANQKLLERINEIYAANGIPAVHGVKGSGGADSADFTSHGIACLDSFGTMGGGVHSRDEWIYIDSIAEGARRAAAITIMI